MMNEEVARARSEVPSPMFEYADLVLAQDRGGMVVLKTRDGAFAVGTKITIEELERYIVVLQTTRDGKRVAIISWVRP